MDGISCNDDGCTMEDLKDHAGDRSSLRKSIFMVADTRAHIQYVPTHIQVYMFKKACMQDRKNLDIAFLIRKFGRAQQQGIVQWEDLVASNPN